MPVKRRRRKPSPRRARSGAAGGSLRDTLVDAAVALIARKGPQGFSLREVARRARVSEAAPYWHFADREALLAAVAEHPALKAAGERTFTLLVQAITECQAVGRVRGGAPEELAVAAWSIVHGLAALLVDGKLKDHAATAPEAERLAHAITDLFMLGLAPRP